MNAPNLYYAMDTIGGYEGTFDGENVLLSAGLAWNNPGYGWTLHRPENPESVFVDSGGFQATTSWDATYPYTIREYFEYAESIDADYAATMDFACEPDLHKTSVSERVTRTIDNTIDCWETYQDHDYSFELIPVIQGWDPQEYRWCLSEYISRGVDADYMAIGTVCKRSDVGMIHRVLSACETLSDADWHLFGLTLNGWKDSRLWGRFRSSDTAAWNWGAESKKHKMELYADYRGKVQAVRDRIDEQQQLGVQS